MNPTATTPAPPTAHPLAPEGAPARQGGENALSGSALPGEVYLHRVGEVAPIVRHHADQADREGRLADPVVEAMHAAGLFRLMIPQRYGGGELTMSEAFPVFEAMARVDGATGWNLCIGSTGLWLTGLGIGDAAARNLVLGSPRGLVAGGVSPFGVRATQVDGGYRFCGRVPFVSGSAHATWLFAAAAVFDGDKPREAADGGAVLVTGIFRPEQATILDTWHVSGMRATSSNDVLIDNLFIPSEMAFPLSLIPTDRDPLAALPLLSRLGAGLSFVALGVATHAIDLLIELAALKQPFGTRQALRERADVQIAVARARALVESARAYLRCTWHEAECAALDGGAPATDTLARLRLSYVAATENAATATDLSYRAAGSSALFEDQGLERCWRDANAVTQHVAVSSRHLERIGQIALGLDPGPGFL